MALKLVWYPTGRSGGPREQRSLLMPGRSLTIGRDAKAQVVLPDTKVSRAHARIDVELDRVVLTDLQSKNGTRVNGQSIQQTLWKPGQIASVGDYEFELQPGEAQFLGTFRPLEERGRISVVLLLLMCFLLLTMILLDFWHAFDLANSKFIYRTFLYLPQNGYPHLSLNKKIVMLTPMILQMIVGLAAMVVFLMWQFRAAANLPALGLTDLGFSPVAVVVWWVLPFVLTLVVGTLAVVVTPWLLVPGLIVLFILTMASVVQVLRSLSEVWRASVPGMSGAHWRRLPTPAVVICWWLFWLILPVVLTNMVVLLQMTDNLRELQTRFPFWLVVTLTVLQHVSMLLGGLLMVKSVNRITDNQGKAYRAMAPQGTQML